MPIEIDNRKLQIKFGGELHEIDADLLIESLVSYSSVTQEAAAYVDPTAKVNIKIKAPEKGSFVLLLDLITSNAPNLLTRENVQLTAEIVAIVGGLYGLKKWLGQNGKPEEIRADLPFAQQRRPSQLATERRVSQITPPKGMGFFF